MSSTCSICLEEFVSDDTFIHLPCHHTLHFHCCKLLAQRSNRCPLCRATNIPNFTLHDQILLTIPLSSAMIPLLMNYNLFSELDMTDEEDHDTDQDHSDNLMNDGNQQPEQQSEHSHS